MGTIILSGSDEHIRVGKIFCVGRNYREHAAEMKSDVPTEPVIFLKPPTALCHRGEKIIIPAISREVHHEAELVVAIARGGKHLSATETSGAVLGYGAGMDMTLRDVQSKAKKKGLPWTIAKGFDTSAPVSEFIPASSLPPDPVFELILRLNGVIRQRVSTSEMIFSVSSLIRYLSSIFTLERGDLIFTGTPAGVGVVNDGDVLEVELAGHVSTSNTVAAG